MKFCIMAIILSRFSGLRIAGSTTSVPPPLFPLRRLLLVPPAFTVAALLGDRRVPVVFFLRLLAKFEGLDFRAPDDDAALFVGDAFSKPDDDDFDEEALDDDMDAAEESKAPPPLCCHVMARRVMQRKMSPLDHETARGSRDTSSATVVPLPVPANEQFHKMSTTVGYDVSEMLPTKVVEVLFPRMHSSITLCLTA